MCEPPGGEDKDLIFQAHTGTTVLDTLRCARGCVDDMPYHGPPLAAYEGGRLARPANPVQAPFTDHGPPQAAYEGGTLARPATMVQAPLREACCDAGAGTTTSRWPRTARPRSCTVWPSSTRTAPSRMSSASWMSCGARPASPRPSKTTDECDDAQQTGNAFPGICAPRVVKRGAHAPAADCCGSAEGGCVQARVFSAW